jgi:hypothetical protein
MPQAQGIRFVENVLHTVWRAVLSILLSAPLSGLIAGAAVEVVGSVATHQFPGPITLHLLAIMFAIVTGYAVALTYAVIEVTRGAVYIGRSIEQGFARDLSHEGSTLARGVQVVGSVVRRL